MAKDKEALIVGDIHGQVEVLKAAIKYADEKDLRIIFLGDIPDSFSRSRRDQIECMNLIYNRLEKGDYCIWGNHDLSYLWPRTHKCSGWTYKKAEIFKEPLEKLWEHENFIAFYYFEDYKILLTHAGLTDHLIPEEFKDTPIEYLKQEASSNDFAVKSKLIKAGTSSGGRQNYGGISWMRPSDYKPLRGGIRQIAGHTPQQDGILKLDKLWIIDVIEYGNKSLVKINHLGDFKEITVNEYLD